MVVKAIKTDLVQPGNSVFEVIFKAIPDLMENSVVVIASKIFSYAENRLVAKTTQDKSEKWNLAKQESDYWLDPNLSKYQCMLTVKGNWMFANGGIDESNSLGDYYSLWPKDPQASINDLWQQLRAHYRIDNLGLIMTDSKRIPLNWVVMGHGSV